MYVALLKVLFVALKVIHQILNFELTFNGSGEFISCAVFVSSTFSSFGVCSPSAIGADLRLKIKDKC